MQGAMEDFLRALRAADVKVSPVEAIDAHVTVATVGFADRELFKDALCATLAKTADEVTRFDETFETFFARETFQMEPPWAASACARRRRPRARTGSRRPCRPRWRSPNWPRCC